MDFAAEFARQAAAGAFGRRFGAGIDQVGNRFGLGQVELVVQKGTLAELARLGHAQAGQQRRLRVVLCGLRRFLWMGRLGRHLQAAGQQQLQHHGAAVGLQLQHVFAGEGVRAGKVQGQSVVDGLACAVPEREVGGLAGAEGAPKQGRHQRLQSPPGHPHNAHGPPARSGGNGNDGVLLAAKHGGVGFRKTAGAAPPCGVRGPCGGVHHSGTAAIS